MERNELEPMKDSKILWAAKAERGLTQEALAERIGMLRTALSQNMSRPRMSLGMFSKILDALDYDVVVVDRNTGELAYKLEVEK